MKKSLLALAVLGAFAGAASAQTNVTVYGVVDAGLTHESGSGSAGSVTKLATGVFSGNRLGFKGTEDLGGGLKANFQLENGFNLDNGTLRQGGALFGRQAHVGLSGGFGAVDVGRIYDPLFIALDSVDPFDTGLAGTASNLMAAGVAGAGTGATHDNNIFGDVRVNNAISYTTPNLGGFSANALYALGEVAGNTSANRTYSLSGTYANGPLFATLVYANNNNATNTNTTKVALAGATYDFRVVKAYLSYETEKNDVGMDYRDWLVGVSAPVGAGTVMASFIDKNDRSAANGDAKQYAVGYTYPMSKRTTLYTAYGHISNDNVAKFFVGDASSGGNAVGAGQASSAFNVGMRHSF